MNLLQYIKPIIPLDPFISSDKSNTDMVLDCRDMLFPMPILKIQEAIESIRPGETLTVLSNDPSFRSGLNAWANKTGHEVIHFSGVETKRAVIRKS
jgi:TusA-related sulfurtransferase